MLSQMLKCQWRQQIVIVLCNTKVDYFFVNPLSIQLSFLKQSYEIFRIQLEFHTNNKHPSEMSANRDVCAVYYLGQIGKIKVWFLILTHNPAEVILD